MARCRKCDRCRTYYEPKGGITNNVGTTTFNNDNEETTAVTWYDLCPKCSDEFHKWFDSVKRVGCVNTEVVLF